MCYSSLGSYLHSVQYIVIDIHFFYFMTDIVKQVENYDRSGRNEDIKKRHLYLSIWLSEHWNNRAQGNGNFPRHLMLAEGKDQLSERNFTQFRQFVRAHISNETKSPHKDGTIVGGTKPSPDCLHVHILGP